MHVRIGIGGCGHLTITSNEPAESNIDLRVRAPRVRINARLITSSSIVRENQKTTRIYRTTFFFLCF
jgi:hypothetical protein